MLRDTPRASPLLTIGSEMNHAPLKALHIAAAVMSLAAAFAAPGSLAQSQRLIVEQVRDGRYITINGVEFQARQYCRRVEPGDEVTFLTGSPDGRCTLASFLDLNSGEKCEVWCTQPLREMP